jgi:hypothetical protein
MEDVFRCGEHLPVIWRLASRIGSCPGHPLWEWRSLDARQSHDQGAVRRAMERDDNWASVTRASPSGPARASRDGSAGLHPSCSLKTKSSNLTQRR